MDLNSLILSQPEELVLRQSHLSERLEELFERLSVSDRAREMFFANPGAVLNEQLGMDVSASSKISTENRAFYRLLNCEPECSPTADNAPVGPYLALLRKALAGHLPTAITEVFARGFNAEADADAGVDSDADVRLDTQADANSEAIIDAEIDLKVGVEAELEAVARAEAEIALASRVELKAVAKTTTTTAVELEASTSVDLRLEADLLSKLEVTVAQELRAELEARAEAEAELTTEIQQPPTRRGAMARGRLSRVDIQRLAGFVAARPALAELVLSSPAARALRGSK